MLVGQFRSWDKGFVLIMQSRWACGLLVAPITRIFATFAPGGIGGPTVKKANAICIGA
jgi:hypothetical protein